MINPQETLYEVTYKCPVLHTEHTVEISASSKNDAEDALRRISPFYSILEVKKKDERQN